MVRQQGAVLRGWLGPAVAWFGTALACSTGVTAMACGTGGVRGSIIGSVTAAVIAGLAGGRLAHLIVIEDGLRHTLTVTEASNSRLRRDVARDDLTGLPNRRHFVEAGSTIVAGAIRYRQPLALLLIDLDGFKTVNDRYGHHGGDRALRRLGEVVRRTLRASDVAARMGGDEFVVLMPCTEAADAALAAERLRRTLAAQADEPALSISIGVAALGGGQDLDALLRRADAALYAAKRAGRARVHLAGDDDAAPTPLLG